MLALTARDPGWCGPANIPGSMGHLGDSVVTPVLVEMKLLVSKTNKFCACVTKIRNVIPILSLT